MDPKRKALPLTAIAYDDPERAFRLQEALVKLHGHAVHDFVDAVVVTRDDEGKVKLHSAINAVTGAAVAGSVAGMVVGLIFMLPWAGWIIGAGVGAAVGTRLNPGFDEQFKTDLIASLKPGGSALVLIGTADLERLAEKIGPLLEGCSLLQSTVDPERQAEIRSMLEKHATQAPD